MKRIEKIGGEERRKKGNIGKRQHEEYIRKCQMDRDVIIIKREDKREKIRMY